MAFSGFETIIDPVVHSYRMRTFNRFSCLMHFGSDMAGEEEGKQDYLVHGYLV